VGNTMRFLATLLAGVLGTGTALSAGAETLTLTNALLIDGTGTPPVAGTTVVVKDGKIAAIRRGGPTEGKVIDLRGRTLLPGLIDAHTHITNPAAALRALQSGVTTARVLGDVNWQSMGTRDLVRNGSVPGPEILAAGPLIRPKPGLAFYVAHPQFGRFLNTELRGPENIAAAVRANLARGADVIKVGASERAGLASTDPRRQELTYDELVAAVTEAKKAGKVVAAHAYDPVGSNAAVRAGVHSIEHGAYLSDETLALMKEKGTFFVPTLAVLSPLGDPRSDSADDIKLVLRTKYMQPDIQARVRRAKALGITVAAATDGSYDDGNDTARLRVAHDMEEMLAVGYTPMETIVNATRNGARVLQIEERTGTIAVGKEADLLVVDRNPLEQFVTLFEPLLVINNGTVVLDRLY